MKIRLFFVIAKLINSQKKVYLKQLVKNFWKIYVLTKIYLIKITNYKMCKTLFKKFFNKYLIQLNIK